MGICVGRMIKALGYLFKKLIKKFHQFCDILPAIISFMVVHLSTNFLAIYIINKQPTEQCIVLLFIPHEKYIKQEHSSSSSSTSGFPMSGKKGN